ncbi:MAG: nucleotidyltransferase family protein [Bacteroidales bacterium]|nr:nucleotidyltransferase family protein [Bacteroidales bacterium]MCL2133642.1 nucleotidyltransferase family protein [Bacteroidales bacterium]
MLLEFVDLTHRRLLALLQSALWNKAADDALFTDMEEEDWHQLFKAAVAHGVMAIAFDGIMREPTKHLLPRSLKITWAANVEAVEQRYNYKAAVAAELAAMLSGESVPVMLFKGLALAQDYPIPQHREFGDLDIYLFGQARKGEQVLIKQGVKKEKTQQKHVVLSYKGVPIENHHYFLNLQNLSYVCRLEQYLQESLQKNVRFNQVPKGQLLYPPTDFHALFLVCHALRHFTRETNLRTLCDWAVFLYANKEKIDLTAYRAVLAEAGWLKAADAFTAITMELFGLDAETALNCQRCPALEEKMLNGILYPVQMPESPSAWQSIKFYYRRIKEERWKYELLYPGRYGRRIAHSVFFHLFHPIRTLKQLKLCSNS